jgi:hypothetical protein
MSDATVRINWENSLTSPHMLQILIKAAAAVQCKDAVCC